MLSCEFSEIFQACNFLKTMHGLRCFHVNFGNFFSLQFYKKHYDTGVFLWILKSFSANDFVKYNFSSQVVFCEFCKTFKNTYFVGNQQTAAFNIWFLFYRFRSSPCIHKELVQLVGRNFTRGDTIFVTAKVFCFSYAENNFQYISGAIPNTVLELFETSTKLLFQRSSNNQMKAKSKQYHFLLSTNEKVIINIDGVNIKKYSGKNCRVGILATYYLSLVWKVCVSARLRQVA